MRKIFIIICLISAAWCAAACEQRPEGGAALPGAEQETPSAGADENAAVSAEYRTAASELSLGGATYDAVTITSLTLSNGERAEALSLINQDLAALTDAYLAALRDQEEPLFAADNSLRFTHELEFSLFYADEEIIAVTADASGYREGAAHPDAARYGYVYDATSGERLTIDVLAGGDYDETLIAAIYSQISAAGETDNYYPDLSRLLLENFAEGQWYADADNLYVIYQPYQIAAYAMGVAEFAVPR